MYISKQDTVENLIECCHQLTYFDVSYLLSIVLFLLFKIINIMTFKSSSMNSTFSIVFFLCLRVKLWLNFNYNIYVVHNVIISTKIIF